MIGSLTLIWKIRSLIGDWKKRQQHQEYTSRQARIGEPLYMYIIDTMIKVDILYFHV